MRQYDVIHNPSPQLREFAPYLVNLQSHYLQDVDTVVVAPLVVDGARPLTVMDIPVTFEERPLILAIAELSSLLAPLGVKRAGSLVDREDDIRRGLEKLFTGF